MGQIRTYLSHLLILALIVALLAGCGPQATPESAGDGPSYSGALDTTAEGALDATTQLALGTLRLEDTPDAVTQEQAASLLPLWQALQGSALKGAAEQHAVLRQIEDTMDEAQVSAIAAMRLTQDDVQAWAQSQGPGSQGAGSQGAGSQGPGNQEPGTQGGGGQRFGGQAGQGGARPGMTEEQIAQMRQQFENMSPEERATRRAQFAGPGGPAGQGRTGGRAASSGLIGAVVALLSERSGAPAGPRGPSAGGPSTDAPSAGREQRPASTPTPKAAQETAQRETPSPTLTPTVEPSSTPAPMSEATPVPAETPAPTPEPVTYVVQAGDALAAIARAYGVSVASIVEANGLVDPNTIEAGQVLVIPNPAQIPSPGIASRPPSGAAASGAAGGAAGGSAGGSTGSPGTAAPALEQLPDKAPGPPFTVEVSANRTTQDPLVDKSRQHMVTGIVRNDGQQTFSVSAIDVTFFDASGFRGTFHKYPLVPGGEWLWHGKTEAEFPCLLLRPGEECPFSVEITAQDMASFLIHPNAVATERESTPVTLSALRLDDQGPGYLRISGTATHDSPFKVKNVTVAGVLLDANGEIVRLGSTYVLQEDIAPGESVPFDLRIEKAPYTRYQLYAQAERDWQ